LRWNIISNEHMAQPPDIEFFQRIHENTAVAQLGIEFTEAGDDFLVARMPHDERTRQPYGLIHGGANVLLAGDCWQCGCLASG
jgi:acyl-coenzyme A thioesterase PaaI-like protein